MDDPENVEDQIKLVAIWLLQCIHIGNGMNV